jgi:hypothetical protein
MRAEGGARAREVKREEEPLSSPSPSPSPSSPSLLSPLFGRSPQPLKTDPDSLRTCSNPRSLGRNEGALCASCVAGERAPEEEAPSRRCPRHHPPTSSTWAPTAPSAASAISCPSRARTARARFAATTAWRMGGVGVRGRRAVDERRRRRRRRQPQPKQQPQSPALSAPNSSTSSTTKPPMKRTRATRAKTAPQDPSAPHQGARRGLSRPGASAARAAAPCSAWRTVYRRTTLARGWRGRKRR